MNAIDKLKSLYKDYSELKNPNWHKYNSVVYPTYFTQSKKTNGLTKCIIAYIRLNGWFAERITSAGRIIDNRKIVTDVVGHIKQIGSKSYIPGTSQKGTADIAATVNGLAVKIEVKNINTKDRQSEDQKGYESITNITGGIYYIARDFESFVSWFDSKFEINPNRFEVYKEFIKNKIVI